MSEQYVVIRDGYTYVWNRRKESWTLSGKRDERPYSGEVFQNKKSWAAFVRYSPQARVIDRTWGLQFPNPAEAMTAAVDELHRMIGNDKLHDGGLRDE